MQHLMTPFMDFLITSCRFEEGLVESCMKRMPQLLTNFQIRHLEEIDTAAVKRAETIQQWRVTTTGIERCESLDGEYLLTLKYFLKYLHSSGFITDSRLPASVTVPAGCRIRHGSLTSAEIQRLRDFLVFNVGDNRSRRDTALMFLLHTVCISLEAALRLKIAKIPLPSGDFCEDADGVFIKTKGAHRTQRKTYLPTETLHFLNFYLENRAQQSPWLFCRSTGKTADKPLGNAAARKIITGILSNCDIDLEDGMVLTVLQNTAVKLSGISSPADAVTGELSAKSGASNRPEIISAA